MPDAVGTKPAMTGFERFSAWIAERVRKIQEQSELDRMPAAEVARMALDLGLSEGELERLAERDDDQALLLGERLELLGLDLRTLSQQGYLRDLERTCALCDSKDDCRHDFVARPDSDDWKSYCPNSGVLGDMLARKG
jgi:hypothetical protein